VFLVQKRLGIGSIVAMSKLWQSKLLKYSVDSTSWRPPSDGQASEATGHGYMLLESEATAKARRAGGSSRASSAARPERPWWWWSP
jgi:hypothetical protein